MSCCMCCWASTATAAAAFLHLVTVRLTQKRMEWNSNWPQQFSHCEMYLEQMHSHRTAANLTHELNYGLFVTLTFLIIFNLRFFFLFSSSIFGAYGCVYVFTFAWHQKLFAQKSSTNVFRRASINCSAHSLIHTHVDKVFGQVLVLIFRNSILVCKLKSLSFVVCSSFSFRACYSEIQQCYLWAIQDPENVRFRSDCVWSDRAECENQTQEIYRITYCLILELNLGSTAISLCVYVLFRSMMHFIVIYISYMFRALWS